MNTYKKYLSGLYQQRQPLQLDIDMQYIQQEPIISTMDQFRITKNLGSGYHSTVKLAMDPNGTQVAIKRYRIQTANATTLTNEINVMKDLNHYNIIKLIDARYKADYCNRRGITYKCLAIILEYASGGELFNYLAYSGRFSEKVTRTFFNQIMNGLCYLHKMGYAHRDLKPQNILLSQDFVLKIADFGFSTTIKEENKLVFLSTELGTRQYIAPEIYQKKYIGQQVDVFACGVILFFMLKGLLPFSSANPGNRAYNLIKEKNYERFWKLHGNSELFSQQFKNLFVRMVAYDPSERPTIEQIVDHPWLRKEVCTHDQIIKEFRQRKQKVKQGIQRACHQQKNRINKINKKRAILL